MTDEQKMQRTTRSACFTLSLGAILLKLQPSTCLVGTPVQRGRRFDHASGSKSPMIDQDGVLYRTSVFSANEFHLISNSVESVMGRLRDETHSSVASHRRGMDLPSDSAIVQLLQTEENSLSRCIRKVCNDDSYILSPDIPVQVRSYEKPGSCMAWHVDDVLYTIPPTQVEVVWTYSNTSDCCTRWKTADGVQHSVETDPNSVVLLRAGVTEHCVTSLRRGKRVILKCAYIRRDQQDLALDSTKLKSQFGGIGAKKQRRKR